jgi:hypothetical protein
LTAPKGGANFENLNFIRMVRPTDRSPEAECRIPEGLADLKANLRRDFEAFSNYENALMDTLGHKLRDLRSQGPNTELEERLWLEQVQFLHDQRERISLLYERMAAYAKAHHLDLPKAHLAGPNRWKKFPTQDRDQVAAYLIERLNRFPKGQRSRKEIWTELMLIFEEQKSELYRFLRADSPDNPDSFKLSPPESSPKTAEALGQLLLSNEKAIRQLAETFHQTVEGLLNDDSKKIRGLHSGTLTQCKNLDNHKHPKEFFHHERTVVVFVDSQTPYHIPESPESQALAEPVTNYDHYAQQTQAVASYGNRIAELFHQRLKLTTTPYQPIKK